MIWTDRINRVAGVTLLLLALGIILSIAFSLGITDADPFERDEVAEFLSDINDNEGLVTYADGSTEEIDRRWIVAADERALTLLAAAVAAVSVAALLARAA